MRLRGNKLVIGMQLAALVIWIVAAALPQETKAATVQSVQHDVFQVSSGVNYKDIRLTDGTTNNAIRVMEMDLNDPYTKIEMGYPEGFNGLGKTTSQSLLNHRDGHMVVGAINGSFFEFRQPMYLVSDNNRLIHADGVFGSDQSYVSEPIAFGINKNGKGIIDSYNLNLNYTYNGTDYKITSVNEQRSPDSTVLYTSDYSDGYTDTNQYGTEVVVELPSKPVLNFGSSYEGTVVGIRKYGDTTNTAIPENGFVLSGHGIGSDALKSIVVGDSISVSINIDDGWKNSKFMLGSGPMLVKDGQVALTMDPNSSRASETAPRTAVAIDKTGDKIFFVTVDGRQNGYSNGMDLTTFANYLVSLGADRALNLDGGGSTTMAVRFPGNDKISLANSPSDGFERGISTFLMAISSEPSSNSIYYKDVQPGDTHYAGIAWLSEKGIQGYADGTFGPAKNLTREHAAIMFSRAMGLTIPNAEEVTKYFNDVNPDNSYAGFIAASGDAGIFKGNSGAFLPEQGLTREQMASTLVNAFGLTNNGKDVKIKLDNVSATHRANVQILANLGITNQLDDFRPKEIVTRGQFATFLYLSEQIALQK